MLYPSNLGDNDGGKEEEASSSSGSNSMGRQHSSQATTSGELDRILESSADRSSSSSVASTGEERIKRMDLTSSSFISEEMPTRGGDSEGNIEARLLYTGNLSHLSSSHDEDEQRSNRSLTPPSPLSAVLSVLSLSPDRLYESEGVKTLDDLHAIEDCIRKDCVSLKSLEKIKLLHYLDWRRKFPRSSPDDFDRNAYRDFLRTRDEPSHAVWPFGRHITDSVLLFPLTFVASDELEGEEREQFGLADLDLELYHSEAGTMTDLYRGLERLRFIVNGSHNDAIIQAFACVKLGLLYHSMQDLVTAMGYLRTAAVEYHVPAACLLYGHSLVTGDAGVARDVATGLQFMNQAATAGVGEAYFIMAQYYERVCNFDKAVQFYKSAERFFVRSDVPGWKGIITGLSALTSSFRSRARYTIDEPLIKGYTECSESTDFHASSTDRTCCYFLLVQTVLLVVLALLSNHPASDHYPILLVGVPTLGLILAIYSMIEASRISRIKYVRRQSIRALRMSKLSAFRSLLKVPYEIPRTAFFYKLALMYYGLVYQMQSSKEPSTYSDEGYVRELEAKLLWIEASGYTITTSSYNVASEFTLYLLQLLLVGLWGLSLLQETLTYKDSCSSWWETTCQSEDSL